LCRLWPKLEITNCHQYPFQLLPIQRLPVLPLGCNVCPHLALTAVNRYYCIVKPRFYVTRFTARKTVFSILLMWLFSFTVGLTVFLNASVEFKWHPHYLFCQVTMPDFPASKVTNFAFVTGFTALPPGIIFFFMGEFIALLDDTMLPSFHPCKMQTAKEP